MPFRIYQTDSYLISGPRVGGYDESHLVVFCLQKEAKAILAKAGVQGAVTVTDAQEANGVAGFQSKKDLGFAGTYLSELLVL